MKYVFPKCSMRSSRIRSLFALTNFLKNPETTAAKTDLCAETAADAWKSLYEDTKNEVKQRMEYVRTQFPGLRDSIKDLKECAFIAHPPCRDFEALQQYFSADSNMLQSLLDCKFAVDSLRNPKNGNVLASEIDDSS